MDADQLAETTMDPRHRTLRRINIGDLEAAEQVFDLLMGNDVAPRKDFISPRRRRWTGRDRRVAAALGLGPGTGASLDGAARQGGVRQPVGAGSSAEAFGCGLRAVSDWAGSGCC